MASHNLARSTSSQSSEKKGGSPEAAAYEQDYNTHVDAIVKSDVQRENDGIGADGELETKRALKPRQITVRVVCCDDRAVLRDPPPDPFLPSPWCSFR